MRECNCDFRFRQKKISFDQGGRGEKVSEHEKENGSDSIRIAFFHVSTDRQCCGTKAPRTRQTQATKSVFAAQEGSTASHCDAADAGQAAAKEGARTHRVVLISIAALFGVPRLRDSGSARHDRRLKAELRALALPPSASMRLLFRSQTSLITCKHVSISQCHTALII
jgi:hypothetical protein